MIEFLDKLQKDRKTYACAVLLAVTGLALGLGWLTREQAEALFGIFGAAGLAALRAGVAKVA